MDPLLQVGNLHVAYVSRQGQATPALAGVNFELAPGEILGVLGESGCGKTTLAAALPRLLPPNGTIQSGSIFFEGKNLLDASPRDLARIRGSRIGLIFQEPSSALHPTIRVSQQVADVLSAHTSLSRLTRRKKTLQVLETVFPQDSERISRCYPHQLSGGQRQRVVIAQAIVCQPALLIADEPTASLDPTTQREVLQLFRAIRDEFGLAIILITHNPLLLSGFADRILVLYAGKVAEVGPAASILASPQHPYSAALLQCLPPPPAPEKIQRGAQLHVIPGDPPDLSLDLRGCRFEPRCAHKMAICRNQEPEAVAVSPAHGVSCFKFVA